MKNPDKPARQPGPSPAGPNARALAVLSACVLAQSSALAGSFGDDLAFLKAYTELVVLSDQADKAQVAIAPRMQARVLTSTARGESGQSFGWINRELISSRQVQPHINVFGGEDRFWMGPEGGQFSIFFAKGAPFGLEHWFTPAALDTEPFETVSRSARGAQFRRSFSLTNYSGARFDVRVNRTVQLLETEEAWQKLGVKPASALDVVGFESVNRIENTGHQPWTKQTGLLSIWILGMFTPSPATTIVIPIKPGPVEQLGPRVTSDYFGAVPPDRLVVRDDVIFFSGDGKFRGKIGISPLRCRARAGSYDSANHVLTLVQFTFRPGETSYVNSKWELQEHPFAGDVQNSYNDGPPAPGAKPLGPFYEMESSSPAAALAPGESIEHVHRTIHLTGAEADLDRIAQATLGVGLQQIATALPRPK